MRKFGSIGSAFRFISLSPPRSSSRPFGGEHSDFELVVEVYAVRSEEEVKALYLEVNKAESVKEIDLPDTIAPDHKRHIDAACRLLQEMYPRMHKPSERCKPPHVHRDTLRTRLMDHRATRGVADGAELLSMILAVNEKLKERPPGSWPDRLTKAVEKARRYGFYLGLNDFAWLDLLESGC